MQISNLPFPNIDNISWESVHLGTRQACAHMTCLPPHAPLILWVWLGFLDSLALTGLELEILLPRSPEPQGLQGRTIMPSSL